MDKINTLRRYGLFDAKVPRYTSYPPANRFEPDVGAKHHEEWLATLPVDEPVSVYVHIPFCRRLCWFCACRTQGTKTLSPVDGYVADLVAEIKAESARLRGRARMARLHLGGGTPTILSPALMNRLLEALHSAFDLSPDFEFSVEIDPTEAATNLLEVLADWGMRRASIGVQDFEPRVQKAIGRRQSYEQTLETVETLRALGIAGVNVDLLYGLPFQTEHSLMTTLEDVVALRPDRIALFGYAHVPHMSKRQSMIPTDELPGAEKRFRIAELAKDRLLSVGFTALGIDHFARPDDSLAKAAREGRMRRNFQGYTDDPCTTLLGFGASAISKLPQGYAQNAVSTAAYRQRVQSGSGAWHKGYQLRPEDRLISDMVEAVMCEGRINLEKIVSRMPNFSDRARQIADNLLRDFPELLYRNADEVIIRREVSAAARLIASHLDPFLQKQHIHSTAI